MISAEELFDKKKGDLVHKLRTQSDLIRHLKIREGEAANYCVFLGAGASVTSDIKASKALCDEWISELYERYNRKKADTIEDAISYFEKEHASWYNPTNAYASLFEKKYDLPNQRRRFIEYEVDDKVPSIGYAYLISLVDHNVFNTIFTTNFDDLINEAFYQFSNNRPILCAHDSSINSISITSKRPKIIKLHGDYLFNDIKSTLRETENLEQNIKEKLIEFCKEFGLIVIGYSGSDRSVMDILEFLAKQDNYLKNGVYWCLRKEDYVNHTLRNLLWKDKVYPVLIDGFDQFLAKIHNQLLKSKLDIESARKQSKLQKTINYIISDKYKLSDNLTINSEIHSIKNAISKQDISSFLNDLSSNDDSELPLSDLRNLLEVEDLMLKNNLNGAYDLCESFFYNSQSEIAKSKYVSKLIKISLHKDDRHLALNWSDKLIEMDNHNLSYYLKKAGCIGDIQKRFDFLSKLIDEFYYRFEIYNEACEVGIELINNDPIHCGVDEKALLGLTEKSLKLNYSLENVAWDNKLQLLINQSNTNSETNDQIGELVTEVKKCNEKHLMALNIIAKATIQKEDFNEAKKLIENIYDLIKKSSKSRKSRLKRLLNKIISNIIDFPNNDGYKKILKN